MWPKALAQLIELAPHIARLLPTADRYLQSRSAGDAATREALTKIGEDVRGDINRVTASHEGIYRQLNEQGERMAQLAEQMTAVRAATEAAEERVGALERSVAVSSALLIIVLPLNVVLLALVIYMVVRH
jgi:phage-related minor tail protein